ncbi:MAG: sensor domain-containing diguanylate cyclase [Campylobacterales bacterium]|nr:sensor domain-containing diguanylate cyclase [Campylobacterales bacterium]
MMQENRIFEALLDVIPFATYAVDIETYEIVYANKQMSETLYAPREEFCWKKVFGQEEVCSWCTIPELKQRGKIYKNDKLIHTFFDEGSDRWFQSHDELVNWPDGRTVRYAILIDITEQKEIQASMIKTHTALAIQTKKLQEANRMLEKLATTDALTLIHNRGHFFKLALERLSTKPPHTRLFAAMLDLDHFKQINDRYGHQAGDAALVAFCRHVESRIDEEDLFGRIGGEEFALLLESESDTQIVQKLDRIRDEIEHISLDLQDGTIQFTVSIGLAEYNGSESLDELLHAADERLYSAKNEGRNRMRFRINTQR